MSHEESNARQHYTLWAAFAHRHRQTVDAEYEATRRDRV